MSYPLPSPPHPLKVARITRGLRQRDLAELAGVSRDTIGRLESGESPTLTTARAIARIIDEPVDNLFPPTEARL